MDPKQYKVEIVIPTLTTIGCYSMAAVNLMMGTALVESRLNFIRQFGGGPALGFCQVEPATMKDHFVNYLNHRMGRRDSIFRLVYGSKKIGDGEALPYEFLEEQLKVNLAFNLAMGRLVYWRKPSPLPDEDDSAGMAKYWKLYYNTPKGKGIESQFQNVWDTFDITKI